MKNKTPKIISPTPADLVTKYESSFDKPMLAVMAFSNGAIWTSFGKIPWYNQMKEVMNLAICNDDKVGLFILDLN